MTSAAELVEALAQALDEDDFETAASVMAPDVRYRIGEEVLTGPDAIVASYRESSEMAHRLFDHVEYGHEVFATDDPRLFRVSYHDVLTINGETLTHNAEQHVTVTPADGVVQIVNIELPGEREKVDRFMARHGLSRDI